ncbi:MAG: GNAT family N-acetyltransferase [Spirochaetia bacterium]|nr:GNAT family N-acetyltransferase [Spirochaetia bacterium]
MNYNIRKATQSDVIGCRLLADYANELMLKRNNPQWSCGYPEIEILYDDVKKEQLYVAYEENELIGMVVIQKSKDKIYEKYDFWSEGPYLSVHRIVSKRSGLGKYFINMAIDMAKEIGANVRLDTHIKNIHMQELVKSLGFVEVGETEQGYIDNTLAITYELVL